MKVRIYLYISDGGDGSVGVELANSLEEAEAAVEAELNYCGQAYCDGGATCIDVEINPDGTYSCPRPGILDLAEEDE